MLPTTQFPSLPLRERLGERLTRLPWAVGLPHKQRQPKAECLIPPCLPDIESESFQKAWSCVLAVFFIFFFFKFRFKFFLKK